MGVLAVIWWVVLLVSILGVMHLKSLVHKVHRPISAAPKLHGLQPMNFTHHGNKVSVQDLCPLAPELLMMSFFQGWYQLKVVMYNQNYWPSERQAQVHPSSCLFVGIWRDPPPCTYQPRLIGQREQQTEQISPWDIQQSSKPSVGSGPCTTA